MKNLIKNKNPDNWFGNPNLKINKNMNETNPNHIRTNKLSEN